VDLLGAGFFFNSRVGGRGGDVSVGWAHWSGLHFKTPFELVVRTVQV
jgi:hypothetical protein